MLNKFSVYQFENIVFFFLIIFFFCFLNWFNIDSTFVFDSKQPKNVQLNFSSQFKQKSKTLQLLDKTRWFLLLPFVNISSIAFFSNWLKKYMILLFIGLVVSNLSCLFRIFPAKQKVWTLDQFRVFCLVWESV